MKTHYENRQFIGESISSNHKKLKPRKPLQEPQRIVTLARHANPVTDYRDDHPGSRQNYNAMFKDRGTNTVQSHVHPANKGLNGIMFNGKKMF